MNLADVWVFAFSVKRASFFSGKVSQSSGFSASIIQAQKLKFSQWAQGWSGLEEKDALGELTEEW